MATDITTAVAQIRSAQLGIDMREAIAQGFEAVQLQISSLKFVKCAKETYTSLETPDSDTVYFVVDETAGTVEMYLGSIKISTSVVEATAE